ncbi:MAG: helix-turn-helix transcriptional regulator [Cytophagales bacterium]
MSKLEYLSRHNLIIKKLRKVPSTFEQIHDYLERESEIQSYHFTVSKRTFQRDIEEILFMYNIEIKYDFSRKVYFISEEPQSDVNMRMLEAFDTFQAFKLSENIAEFICFEKRKPQGTQYLLNLLQAIKNQQVIILSHHKFEYQDSVERELEPLALKESRGRWYLVANVA